MAQVTNLANDSANLIPCSPQPFNQWRAQRLQNPWIYKGPDAAKTPGLVHDQVSYAVTPRHMMVINLLGDAPTQTKAPVFSDAWHRNFEWNTIRTALKREISRCDRAQKRLAGKKAVAA